MVHELNESNDLPVPPILKTLIRVDYVYGDESVSLLCAQCGLTEVRSTRDRWLSYPTKCLHAVGQRFDPSQPPPKILTCIAYLIPIQYVTYVGLGEGINSFHQIKGGDLYVVQPSRPPAVSAMTEERIRVALGELRDIE